MEAKTKLGLNNDRCQSHSFRSGWQLATHRLPLDSNGIDRRWCLWGGAGYSASISLTGARITEPDQYGGGE